MRRERGDRCCGSACSFMRACAPAGLALPPPPRRSRPAFPPAARGAGTLPPLARPGGPHGVLPGHQLPASQQRALSRHQRRLQGTALQEGRSLAGNCHLLAPSLTCPPHGRSGAAGWVLAGPWVPTQRGSRRGPLGAALARRALGTWEPARSRSAGRPAWALPPRAPRKSFSAGGRLSGGRGYRAGGTGLAHRGGSEGLLFSCGSPWTASWALEDGKVNF